MQKENTESQLTQSSKFDFCPVFTAAVGPRGGKSVPWSRWRQVSVTIGQYTDTSQRGARVAALNLVTLLKDRVMVALRFCNRSKKKEKKERKKERKSKKESKISFTWDYSKLKIWVMVTFIFRNLSEKKKTKRTFSYGKGWVAQPCGCSIYARKISEEFVKQQQQQQQQKPFFPTSIPKQTNIKQERKT